MKEFKQILKELRTSKNLSQEALGNIIHVSRSAIAKYENGLGLPSEEVIVSLCNYFNVDKDFLFPKDDVEKLITEKNIMINNQRKKHIIITLALSLVITILLIFIILFDIKNPNNTEKAYILDDVDEVIDLNDKDYTNKIGLLLKYEGGYVYQGIEIYKIGFTDSTNLYVIRVQNTYTNGYMANVNNSLEFNTNEYTEKVYMGIDLMESKNFISFGSWHRKRSTIFHFTSMLNRNGEYLINEDKNLFDGARIIKDDKGFTFSYVSSITNWLFDYDYNNVIRKCKINNNQFSSSWEYEMIDESAKEQSFTITSLYLIETSSGQLINFNINTQMNNTNMYIKQTKKIKLYT